MDKKMTSGEIAKKAGVSQKAIRLYDEKGLLKPSEYSEGNYRLYDEQALLVLEKIIALKKVGFSLEEIRDNLVVANNVDIVQSLHEQLEIMEKKKKEIEQTIDCIKGMLTRTEGQPDWNHVAEIARSIQQDQKADDRHFHALQHTVEKRDWYERLYESLQIKENRRVLDLGCGYGKLWGSNWRDIPEAVHVDGIDLHGSWADDFELFIADNKEKLASNIDIVLHWHDVEDAEIWNSMEKKEKYHYVIAHYLMGFIQDKEGLVQRAASVLQKGGMFSCNSNACYQYLYWKDAFEKIGLKHTFIEEKIAETQSENEKFQQCLEEHFERVEIIRMSNGMRYETSEEVFERLCDCFVDNKKFLQDNKSIIMQYYDDILAKESEVIVESDSEFWHCFK